jgi:hypothetical protein
LLLLLCPGNAADGGREGRDEKPDVGLDLATVEPPESALAGRADILEVALYGLSKNQKKIDSCG